MLSPLGFSCMIHIFINDNGQYYSKHMCFAKYFECGCTVAGQGDWPPYTTTNNVFTIRIVIKTKHVG